jgi:AraC family transcriptional regulator
MRTRSRHRSCAPGPARPGRRYPIAARKLRVIVDGVAISEAPGVAAATPARGDRNVEIMATSVGRAWKDLQVETVNLPAIQKGTIMSETKEVQVVLILAGAAQFEEREIGGRWLTSNIAKGDFFLTAPGPLYEMRWKVTGPLPYQAMVVSLGLPVFERAMKDVFGKDAQAVSLRDISGFQDSFMASLMERLLVELRLGHQASPCFVQGAAQALAVHLARNYTFVSGQMQDQRKGWGLPGFTLRRISDLMASNLADDFSLARLAREAEMSEFHFSRMFKRTTGRSPSQYFISLKMERARALLRQTRKSVIEIGLELGYTSPSHFAQVFRRETGSTPGAYRRQA